jgi:hypothetical protein
VARLVRLQRRIGRLAGLIAGNPQQLLIQLYGVADTLAWSGGVTSVLLKLESGFGPPPVTGQHGGRPRHFATRRGFS